MSWAGVDNVHGNFNNTTFFIKNTNLYVPSVNLSARGNQKSSKILSKGCETSVFWNEYKKYNIIKIQQMNTDNFWNQTLLELIDCLF